MTRHAAFSEKPAEAIVPQSIDAEKPDEPVHADHQQGMYDGASSLAPIGTRGTDTEKGSQTGLVLKEERSKATRKLLLKLDVAILPFAVLLYLSAYLDRGNLANARLQGLEEKILNDSDTNYSIALACFFITYIICSVPGTLLARQINPSISIAGGAMIWSIAATCQAAVTDRASLFVCRLFVGIGEACFGQAMAFHLSLWYTKRDLAKRIGLFISAGALSGAFGGLIAFGVASINNPSIDEWRILFLIEGCPSVLLAIAVCLFMPSRPETSRYLTEDERTLCLTRLNEESSVDSSVGIDWTGVKRCFMDWKTYVVSVAYSCLNLGLGSVGGFLPTIIKGLGYSNARAQLFTVPPYAVALVFMLLLTSFSDRYQTRGLPAASVFCIGLMGWAILLGVNAAGSYHLRYFGCICVVVAGYTNIPIMMSWQSGNTGNQSQRAASLGMLNTLGQCLSLAAAFLFPSKEGPQYSKGCTVNVAFQCLGLTLVLLMTTWYRYENRRRDRVEGGRPSKGSGLDTVHLFDLAPGFRYVP